MSLSTVPTPAVVSATVQTERVGQLFEVIGIDRDAMRAQFVALCAETFSEQELRDIIAFYRTPIS